MIGNLVNGHVTKCSAVLAWAIEDELKVKRGTLFVGPMEKVYAGMIVGEHCRGNDLPCNPTKKKHLSAHRSATREVDVRLDVPHRMLLEPALEWIAEDELVEVTPQSVRLRKFLLDADERKRANRTTAQQT